MANLKYFPTQNIFRNLANMGKSKSLDTEESAESDATSPEACDIFKNCQSQHRVENNCRNCSGSDRARDLELNKVRNVQLFFILQFPKKMNSHKKRKCPLSVTFIYNNSLFSFVNRLEKYN